MSYCRFKKLMRHIDCALQPVPGEQCGVFWKVVVQPLMDAFNSNRAETFQAGQKLLDAAESMSAAWALLLLMARPTDRGLPPQPDGLRARQS